MLAELYDPGISPPIADSDGDGIPNDQDLCPETPPSTPVSANGCSPSQEAQLFLDLNLCTEREIEAQQQLTALEGQLAGANQTIANLNTENAQLQSQVNALSVQVGQLQTQLAAANATIQTVTQANQALTAQNAQLQQEVQTLQSQLAQLTTALVSGLTSLQNDFRVVFNNPTFVVPGTTPQEQYQNLVTAILNLNKGQKRAIYVSLGGK